MLRPRTLVRGNEIIRKNRTIGSTRYTTVRKSAVTGSQTHGRCSSRRYKSSLSDAVRCRPRCKRKGPPTFWNPGNVVGTFDSAIGVLQGVRDCTAKVRQPTTQLEC